MSRWRRHLREAWIRLIGGGHPRPLRAGAIASPKPDIDSRTLEQGLSQIEILRRQGLDFTGCTLLDLGTGWQPTIPLLYHLAGIDDIILVDPERVLDQTLLARTAANLRGHAREIAQRLELTEREVVQRLRVPKDASLFETLRFFHLQYLAPYDLLTAPFAEASVDLITSRAPLEHYTARYFDALLPVFSRILRPDGLLCLSIDRMDRLEYLELMRRSSCRLLVEESDTELRVIDEGASPQRDPTRSLAFLLASCPQVADEDAAR